MKAAALSDGFVGPPHAFLAAVIPSAGGTGSWDAELGTAVGTALSTQPYPPVPQYCPWGTGLHAVAQLGGLRGPQKMARCTRAGSHP